MNNRLFKKYARIEEEQRKLFLQNNIVPDDNWGKKIEGATLQIDLSDGVNGQIHAFQTDLAQLEPHALLFSPRPFQHLSFNQVVYWNGNYKKGVAETWAEIDKEFIAKFMHLDHQFSAFTVTFFSLIAHTNAIIWCAYDENDEMEILRNQLFDLLPFPKETEKRNHIIHTSIVRFKQKLSNPEAVVKYVNSRKEQVAMQVKEIILRQENQYPSLNAQEIARIRLL